MTQADHGSDDRAKVSEYFRLTLSFLSKHNIPADPINYQIAYEYVSGRNNALAKQLEEILKKNNTPSEKQLKSIYKQYFVQDEEFFETMRRELRHIITSMLDEFGYSGGKLSNYSQTLNRFIEILDHPTSSKNMLKVTKKVIEETHSVEQNQQRLESQILNVIAEVDSLRKELEQVKEESVTDSLTGIPNRKAFDSALENVVHSSRENKRLFSLLIADIDHFKKFNDTYGHLVGDKVLRYVASSLKRNIKGNDMAARFGGEEFAIILPSTKLSGALCVAEQIREGVSSGKLTDKSNDVSYGKITISIGVTQFRISDIPSDLIQRADKALYLAKERGRNRVEKL